MGQSLDVIMPQLADLSCLRLDGTTDTEEILRAALDLKITRRMLSALEEEFRACQSGTVELDEAELCL